MQYPILYISGLRQTIQEPFPDVKTYQEAMRPKRLKRFIPVYGNPIQTHCPKYGTSLKWQMMYQELVYHDTEGPDDMPQDNRTDQDITIQPATPYNYIDETLYIKYKKFDSFEIRSKFDVQDDLYDCWNVEVAKFEEEEHAEVRYDKEVPGHGLRNMDVMNVATADSDKITKAGMDVSEHGNLTSAAADNITTKDQDITASQLDQNIGKTVVNDKEKITEHDKSSPKSDNSEHDKAVVKGSSKINVNDIPESKPGQAFVDTATAYNISIMDPTTTVSAHGQAIYKDTAIEKPKIMNQEKAESEQGTNNPKDMDSDTTVSQPGDAVNDVVSSITDEIIDVAAAVSEHDQFINKVQEIDSKDDIFGILGIYSRCH